MSRKTAKPRCTLFVRPRLRGAQPLERKDKSVTYRTITTILTDPELGAAAFNAAVDLARREQAHLDVLCLGLDRTQPGFYYAGANAMVVQDNLTQAREDSVRL